jgi:hypothetical protein
MLICCNGCTCMLQASIHYVSSVGRDVDMLQWLYMYVASVYPLYFICFLYVGCKCILSGCCICCKCIIGMLRVFAMTFQVFSYVFCRCFRCMLKCFICLFFMLPVLHFDVSKVDRDVGHVMQYVLSVYSKCFICFRYMLQIFHLDVAK